MCYFQFMKKFNIQPSNRLIRFADWLMTPLMYIVSGTFRESPQQTHRWNNTKLNKNDIVLNRQYMARGVGNQDTPSGSFLRIHLPILGGLRNYVVLEPMTQGVWHVGWEKGDRIAVTRIPLKGPVRMLVGQGDAHFFGIDANGYQIPIKKIGTGRIGDRGPYTKLPLL